MVNFVAYSTNSLMLNEFAKGAASNGRVIIALIYRDASNRFGSGPFSYIWTLVEPSLLIALMLLMRIYLRSYSAAFGDSSALFLLTGFLTFRMVRTTINVGGKSISNSIALFAYGPIKPPDVVLARVTVEYSIWLMVLIFFFSTVRWILGYAIITRFQDFVLVIVYMYFFCFAMSFFNATVGSLVPVWRTIWKIMTLPLLFISGVLYVPAALPPNALAVISWNPLLHCIEGLRAASYLDYLTVYDPLYLNMVSATLLIFSFAIERLFRKKILRSRPDEEEDDDI